MPITIIFTGPSVEGSKFIVITRGFRYVCYNGYAIKKFPRVAISKGPEKPLLGDRGSLLPHYFKVATTFIDYSLTFVFELYKLPVLLFLSHQ
jgi:hypothetical protein